MGQMHMMGKEGDTKVAWDKTKIEEVRVAEAAHDRMVGQGYLAFSVKDDGKGERMHVFDPNAEKVILVPPVAGG